MMVTAVVVLLVVTVVMTVMAVMVMVVVTVVMTVNISSRMILSGEVHGCKCHFLKEEMSAQASP